MTTIIIYKPLISIIVFYSLVLWIGFVFAKLEIMIEGEHGWAEKLPAWRLPKNHILSKLFSGGRELTGYHVWVHVFVFSMLHLVYIFELPTLSTEMTLWAFLFYIWVVEDFLWFVLNPAFGVRKFKKKHIAWHPNWWLFAPIDYFVFLPLATLLYWLAHVLA